MQPDPIDARVRADIDHHGWHVVIVPPHDSTPGWAHSIGLFERYRHPELLVFGSDPHRLGAVLNTLGERVRGGQHFAAEEEVPGILAGLPFAFRSVAPRWTSVVLGNAAWHYQREDFPRLQGFWPDRDGLFPWQRGCTPEVVAEQPQLAHAELHLALSEPLLATLLREGAL